MVLSNCGKHIRSLHGCVEKVRTGFAELPIGLPELIARFVLSFIDPVEEFVCVNYGNFMDEYRRVIGAVVAVV